MFLSTLKAEVAVAQTGRDQHVRPSEPRDREQIPEYAGHDRQHALPAPACRPPVGRSGLLPDRSRAPAGDDRVIAAGLLPAHRRRRRARYDPARDRRHDDLLAAAASTTAASRISPLLHTYAVDGASTGVTADFPPTVIARPTQRLPLATEAVIVSALVNDRESPITAA